MQPDVIRPITGSTDWVGRKNDVSKRFATKEEAAAYVQEGKPPPEKKRKKEQDKIAWGWASKQWIKNIWSKYGLTYEQYRGLWDLQEGKCAGCQEDLAHPIIKEGRVDLKPEVDHDHLTGIVRGLLCRRCNDFLGRVNDNKETLRRLIEYLERNGGWNEISGKKQ